jgi:hypothetical protein
VSPPPLPSGVAADLAALLGLVREVGEAYGWLYDSGYSRETARDRVGTGRTTVVDDEGETMPPTADPAGESVLGQARVRSKLAFAGRQVARARGQLAGALAALHEIAELVDDGAGHLPDEHVRIPRTVTKGELAWARAAQQRRIARGEGLGPVGRVA